MERFFLPFAFFLIFPIHGMANASLVWQETQIPITADGQIKLESLLVYPNDGKKHPLALISHGSPRDAKDRAQMNALYYLPIAYEFARRGYSTAVVLRRGYGTSGGGWAEGFGSCTTPDYLHAAAASTQDLRAAINYLGTIPQFDTNTILAVGVSAGGFASIALSGLNPPPGLKGAISFAGGRGSSASNTVCHPELLTSAFAEFGKHSKVPTLWIYAENDHFFNSDLAKKMFSAFVNAGGNASFIQAAPYGNEGHFLFSNAGIPLWTPLLDNFLISQHLKLSDTLLPLPISQLSTPDFLSKNAKKAFDTYKTYGPHKAFAAANNGAYGWRSGQRSKDLAEKSAMDTCRQHSTTGCKLIAVDDESL